MTSRKDFYSKRQDSNLAIGKFDLAALRKLFWGTYRNFEDRCYFQQSLGYYCVDNGFIEGTTGADPSLYFLRKLKRESLWPIDEGSIQDYSETDIFDVIELLFDLVAKPVDGTFHRWDNCGWHYHTFDKEAGQIEFRTELNEILEEYGSGFELSRNGRVEAKLSPSVNSGTKATTHDFGDVFKYGIPISLQKPIGTLEQTKDGQEFGFKESDRVGILKGNVYPDFCVADFSDWAKPALRLKFYSNPDIRIGKRPASWGHVSWTIAHNLCQTDSERVLFLAYMERFVIPYKRPNQAQKGYRLDFAWVKDRVPALIPQAWINWNSESRNALNRMGYKDSNLPYRLDFVAFWGGQRYVIMIDGIEHYGLKSGGRWDANEEKYAARLKEDRLLRTQGWNLFRLGNWETRDQTRLEQVLEELREFIGFDSPPIPPPLEEVEEIPF